MRAYCWSLILSLTSLLQFSISADPTCAKGITNADRKVCCPSYCGACSTSDCASRPGGYWECCYDGIKNGKGSCTANDAPCNMVAAAAAPNIVFSNGDAVCSKGILNSDKSVCCPSYCGSCNQDSMCAYKPGGKYECCPDTVKQFKGLCSVDKAPCKMTSAVAPALSNADPVCSKGILNSDKSVCCPSYCGACQQDNQCSTRPGSKFECCPDTVKQSKGFCSVEKAPCQMQASVAVAPVVQQPVTVPAAVTGSVRAVSIGIMPGDPNKNIFDRMRLYDTKVNSVLLYQSVQYLSWSYVKSNLDAGLKVQLVLEFHDSYPNLWDIASGKYDSQLSEIFTKVRQDGRSITVRLFHEHNGDWYNWGALAGGSNSFEAYKAAFRHASGVIRRLAPNVKIQMGYNSLNAQNDKTSFAQQYPGDAYVDEICVSAYNFCGVSQWHTKVTPIGDIIGPWYKEMITLTKKPLCIGEMSSTNMSCGGKAAWLRSTWNSLATEYTRITSITWFFLNTFSLKEDLDLNSPEEINAWKEGARNFKSVTGYAAGDEAEHALAREIEVIKAEEMYMKELKKRGLVLSIHEGKLAN